VKLIQSTLDEDTESIKVKFVTCQKPDMSVFTPRQLKIIDEILFTYKEVTPSLMSSISHVIDEPWDMTVRKKGLKQQIDFNLALKPTDPVTPKEAELKMRERREMIHNFPFELSSNAQQG